MTKKRVKTGWVRGSEARIEVRLDVSVNVPVSIQRNDPQCPEAGRRGGSEEDKDDEEEGQRSRGKLSVNENQWKPTESGPYSIRVHATCNGRPE